jgi:hypothetical protein
MQININDDLINKLRKQADDKDLSEIVAHAIEFFLTCSEVEATSAEHPKKPFKMIKGGAYDGLFNSVIKHGLWDEK